mgnify:CR=1 FL=1
MNLSRTLFVIAVFFICIEAVPAAPFDGFVEPEHWAEDAVKRSINEGVLRGYSDGKFHGKKLITRYQAAVWYARLSDSYTGRRDGPYKPTVGSCMFIAEDMNERLLAGRSELKSLHKRVDKIAELLNVDFDKVISRYKGKRMGKKAGQQITR